MRRLLLLLLVLVVAILIGIQIKTNPGYVLISTNHIAIETRLWFAIVALVVLFFILYFSIRLFKYTGSIPSRWSLWRRKEKQQKATRLTNKGLMDLAKGDWQAAQKYLMKQVKNAPAPLINYLAAAIAAGKDGDLDKRDYYLHQAIDVAPHAKLGVGLVQAQLQYDAAQYELAIATLTQLKDIAPKQKQILALSAKVYKKLEEWESLAQLLPSLQKYSALPKKQLENYTSLSYCHLFLQANDISQVKHQWKQAPAFIREQTSIIILYVQALIRINQYEEAGNIIRDTLKSRWSSDLARLYSKVLLTNAKKQLACAESWFKSHSKDASLLYTLGHLCERNKLWGKAKGYYTDSLKLQASPQTYVAFAQLLEQLGEHKESLVYYRRGLLATISAECGVSQC